MLAHGWEGPCVEREAMATLEKGIRDGLGALSLDSAFVETAFPFYFSAYFLIISIGMVSSLGHFTRAPFGRS